MWVNRIYTQLGRENSSEKRLWEVKTPQVVKIGTAFQNRIQLGIGSETMHDGQHHHAGLRDAEPLNKREMVDDMKGVKMYSARIIAWVR